MYSWRYVHTRIQYVCPPLFFAVGVCVCVCAALSTPCAAAVHLEHARAVPARVDVAHELEAQAWRAGRSDWQVDHAERRNGTVARLARRGAPGTRGSGAPVYSSTVFYSVVGGGMERGT